MAIEGLELVLKIAVAAALGGIVGSERESVLKQRLAGLRAFALVTMLGGLAGALVYQDIPVADTLPALGFIAVVAYAYLMFRKRKTIAIGTSTLSLIPIMYLIGLMAGLGMLWEAAAIEFVVLAVMAARRSLHHRADSMAEKELNEMIQFGLILFVIFPLLPKTPITIDGIAVDLVMLFGFILLVSLLNLLAFLANRIFRAETGTLTGFIGGVINSSLTIHYIAKKKEGDGTAARSSGATAAMLGSIARNALLAAVVMPDIFTLLLPLFAIIGSVMIVLIWLERRATRSSMEVEQTFTVISGVKLAAMLLVILVAFQLVAKSLPEYVPLLSLISGAVSSGYTMLSLGTVYISIGVHGTIQAVALTIVGSFATSVAVAFIYGSRKFGMTMMREAVVATALMLGYVVLIAA